MICLTDKQFIKRVSKNYKIPQVRIKAVLDAVELQLKEEITRENKKIKVCDIIFYPSFQKGKMARNPLTGEKVYAPTRKKVKVKMSSDWGRLFMDYNFFDKDNNSCDEKEKPNIEKI